MQFYTYIFHDPSRNNEPIYVGKGCDDRVWSHFYRTDMHPFVQRLQFMKKNNVKPVIGIYAGLDEEFAFFLEEELIAKFGRKDLGLGPLLNLSNGGEGNGNRSDEYKRRRDLFRGIKEYHIPNPQNRKLVIFLPVESYQRKQE